MDHIFEYISFKSKKTDRW